MSDNRLRYFHIVYKEDEKIYEGFLLHDEAWSLLKLIKAKKVSITNTGKTSSTTSASFIEFKKGLS